MINTVINSFKFNTAYSTNAFIYRLKKLPWIGKIFSSSLYKSEGIKTIVNIVVAIIKLLWPFIGKIIYVSMMIYLPIDLLKAPQAFLTIFVFLTLVGAFANTDMFNPSKDKFYSVVLMKIDAKKYATSSFCYFLLKLFLSFYPSIIIVGLLCNVNLFVLLLLPLFVVMMKCISNSFYLLYYQLKGKALNENNIGFVTTISIIGLLLAYGLSYLGAYISNFVFIIIMFVAVILGLLSLRFILKNRNYSKIYKKMLNLNTVIFDVSGTNTNNMKKQYSDKIQLGELKDSNKKGYDYFNELFTMRHKKILTKSSTKTAFILFAIFLGVTIATRLDQEFYTSINHVMLSYLPYFVFIMYLINRGSVITQAMFINCDNSMLTYRFYKNSKVILNLFRLRLKTLIRINLLPTIIIAIGLPLLLAITGGTSNDWNYLLIFISIVFLSIFFSVHHLVIYYLLQPYDINMKAKSNMYSIVNAVTYFICYMCIDISAPTFIFAIFVTLFSLIYILLALYLVYRYAPKTFKLK